MMLEDAIKHFEALKWRAEQALDWAARFESGAENSGQDLSALRGTMVCARETVEAAEIALRAAAARLAAEDWDEYAHALHYEDHARMSAERQAAATDAAYERHVQGELTQKGGCE